MIVQLVAVVCSLLLVMMEDVVSRNHKCHIPGYILCAFVFYSGLGLRSRLRVCVFVCVCMCVSVFFCGCGVVRLLPLAPKMLYSCFAIETRHRLFEYFTGQGSSGLHPPHGHHLVHNSAPGRRSLGFANITAFCTGGAGGRYFLSFL